MSDNRDIVERLEDEARVFEQTLLDETVDLIREAAAEIARLREERRWIPVGERLPEVGEEVLVTAKGWIRTAFVRIDGGWGMANYRSDPALHLSPTHWMPLPWSDPLPPLPEGEG